MEWYEVNNIEQFDSPAVLLYPDRIRQNIDEATNLVRDKTFLRPHVKTSKISEVCKLMLDVGITKFKCATIAEAEMLGLLKAPDVLLAFQPVGPKLKRFLQLITTFNKTRFSCLIDNFNTAEKISDAALLNNLKIRTWIDLNTGMDRTGIKPGNTSSLFEQLRNLEGVEIAGIHAYDGQIHDEDETVRHQQTIQGFTEVLVLQQQLESTLNRPIPIIAGGSVTFPFYRKLDVECSPGTFVFWDWSYSHLLPGEPFQLAALVITRVISVIDDYHFTTDLGHKSLAPENPMPRVHFLNAPGAVAVGHSEEHLVVRVPESSAYQVGDLLYGVPVHICPTISMYEEVLVVNEHNITHHWPVTARNKKITI